MRGKVFTVQLASFLLITVIIHYLDIYFIRFCDEVLYIKAGEAYLRGVPPIFINFEHPPLAKYLIGFFYIIKLGSYLPLITILLSVFLMSKIISQYLDKIYAYLYTIVVITDTLIINMLHFNLLDQVALIFTSAFIYAVLKFDLTKGCSKSNKEFLILGLLMGLALASKWSSAYVVLPALITACLFRRYWIKSCGLYLLLCIAFSSYIATFAMDFIDGGPQLFIKHNIEMIKYMIWRHSITLPLVINGFLTLIGKVSFWSHQYHEYLTLIIANSTYINYTASVLKMGELLIEFNCWLGSFAWPLMFYYSLKLIYDSIKSRDNTWAVISLAILGSALLPILHGNIAWYYLFYAVFAPIAIVKYASRKLLVAIIIANITQVALLKLGILNTTYSFSLNMS